MKKAELEKKYAEKKAEDERKKAEEQAFKPLESKLPQLKPIGGSLPPLVDKKYEKPVEDLLKDRAAVLLQLNSYKAVEEKLRNQQAEEKAP